MQRHKKKEYGRNRGRDLGIVENGVGRPSATVTSVPKWNLYLEEMRHRILIDDLERALFPAAPH